MTMAKFSTEHTQRGSFLLEALIAILIVALGVLGSVGLLARSMQDIDDARNRGEAAALANGLIAQMWMTDRLTANLVANYSSSPGTATDYTDFKALVDSRLPNAGLFTQEVVVVAGPIVPAIPANQSNSTVTITIRWLPAGEKTLTAPAVCAAAAPPTCGHQFSITASIGANQ